MEKKGMGCLMKLVLTIAIIAVLIIIAVVVVGNLTPEQLGFADVKLMNDMSLRDMGLHDTKLKDLWGFIQSFTSPPKEDTIVTNAPTQEDKTQAEGKLEGSSITNEDGSLDYSAIVNGKVTYTKKGQLVYKDTELAYIFNSVLDAYNDKESTDSQIQLLQQLNAKILEVTLQKEDNKLVLKTVMSIDIAQYIEQINSQLPPFIKLSNILYITVTNYIDDVADGKLVTSARAISVNGQPEALSKSILTALLQSVSVNGKPVTQEDICNGVGSVFTMGIGNLGKVGTYDGQTEKLGLHAIDADKHTITLVTYTEVEV